MAVKRVEGVVDAEFSYEEGAGLVTYDAGQTDPEAFIAELADKTGFIARVLAPGETPGDAASDGIGIEPRNRRDRALKPG